eukprot:6716389-Pyramimonas_sp.AAC.1
MGRDAADDCANGGTSGTGPVALSCRPHGVPPDCRGRLRLQRAPLCLTHLTPFKPPLNPLQTPQPPVIDPLEYAYRGLDTDTVELTVVTLLSHLVTPEFNSPADSLRPRTSVSSPAESADPTGMQFELPCQ